MLIGTAGHIDHGKTTLVKALTGVDADRLPEEKARGITLDLGYAYAPLDDGSVLAYVDVPGHEKLVRNMLAGATAIDFALLVIAADDGPMPQTREHLELLDLLGLTQGAVALTKTDAVPPQRLAEAHAQAVDLLDGTGLSGGPVFAVSGLTGEGVAELRAHLEAAAAAHAGRQTKGRFRLAIDRAFSLTGVGTVVTGTAHAGSVAVGDVLVLSPPGRKARVRGLHVQDRPAEQGCAGERCALALKGDFEKKDIGRGMWLVDDALALPLSRFHAELRVPAGHKPVTHLQSVHVHIGTEDIVGRAALLDCRKVEAGGSALAEILLERETLALHGDRFVLRDAGARHTVAGGRVLDIFPPGRHKRDPHRLELLDRLRTDDPAGALGLLAAQAATGVDLAKFCLSRNLLPAETARLARSIGLHVVGDADSPVAITPGAWDELQARLVDALTQEHERAPDMPGVEPGRLHRMTSIQLPRAAFDSLSAQLLSAGTIAQTRTWLHLPEHRASLSDEDRSLYSDLRTLLDARPYNPPRVRDLFNATGIPEASVRQLFKRIARAGELYPVAHDHYFTAEAVAELAEIVRRLSEEHGAARAAPFRDIIFNDGGGGRKVAIRILEFFDRVGYTRRVGDDHILRREGVVHEWTGSR